MKATSKRSRMAGRWLAVVTVASALVAACTVEVDLGADELTGSGVRETRTFDLAGFDRVDVSHTFAADVTVDAGGDHSIEITADDNFFDEMEVEVRSSTLHLGFEDNVNIRSDERPQAVVVVPSLAGVQGSGASTTLVRASGTSLDDIELSGASGLTAEGLDGAALAVEVSGASTAVLRGSQTSMELAVSGASSVDLVGLEVDAAEIDVSGASRIEFGPVRTVTGGVSGASTVALDEGTTTDLDVSGASTVRKGS